MPTIKFLLQKPYKDRIPHMAKGGNSKEKSPSKKTKKDRPLNPLETRLYLFLIVDHSNVARIKTEYVIYPGEWDFRTQLKKEIKGNAVGTVELNKEIEKFNEGLQKLKKDTLEEYRNMVKEDPDKPFAQIADKLKESGKTKENPFRDKKKSFFEIFDEFVSSTEGEVSPRTIQKYGTLKNSLQELGNVNKKYETLSFSMINKSFLTVFTKYLRTQKPRGRQKSRPEGEQYGLLNDTVGKYIETLKTFLKWSEEWPSEENPYNKFTAYKKFSNSGTKLEKKAEDIVTLTWSELRHFYAFDFSGAKDLTDQQQKTYTRVKDLFCFGCFTGQRWSDIERLDKTEIQGDTWSFNSYKTKKETNIYFIGFASPALDILKKYDFELPKISLQKFNLYLKKAAEAAGINTPIKVRRYVGKKEIVITKPKYSFLGSHAGRRTCVSILLNDCNMNVTHVKEITGHSDLDTLQKYVNEDRKARRDAMSQTKRIDEPLTIVKEQKAS